jgi:O-antigen/teichoic acid export membrane protein
MDILLSSRVYSLISYLEFLKGFVFVAMFFLFFLIYYFDNPYEYLIISFVLSNLFISAWIFPKVKKIFHKSKIQYDSNPLKIDLNLRSSFLYSFNFSSLEYLCSTLIIYSSSILMIIFFGTESVGDLQVVARPIYLALIAVLSFPVFRFLFPEFLNLIKTKRDNDLNKIRKIFNRLTIYIGLFLIVLSWLFSGYFVSFLFPDEYIDGAYFLNILIISIPFVVYTSFLFAIIKSYEHFRATFLIRFFGLIAFITMASFLFVIGFKEILFIYSLLFSSLIMFIIAFIYERQIKKY